MAADFKSTLRKWRGNRRQKEAAAQIEVELSTYRAWESGTRHPKDPTRLEIERRMAAKPDTTK